MTAAVQPLPAATQSGPVTTARIIALTAIALGVAADLMLRVTWGLNAALWFAALTAVALWARRSGRSGTWTAEWYWFVPALSGALLLAFRYSGAVRFLNLAMVLLSLTLPMLHHRLVNLRSALPSDLVMAAVRMALTVLIAPFQLAPELVERGRGESPGVQRVRAIAGGLLVGIPIALVFSVLFAQADPVLRTALEGLFDWRIEKLIEHATVFGVFAWFAAGITRAMALREARDAAPFLFTFTAPFTPPLTSVVTVLATTAGAFLLFVGSQAGQLFAGADLIVTTPGLSYAKHAKDGFFELLAVSVLVLPLSYASEWLTEKAPAKGRTSLRSMQIVLLILVFLVMLSAAYRMQLYVGAYGLTEDRLYGSALMLWLAIVAAGFGATVLRGHRRSFTRVVVGASFAVVGSLNVVNPDALIARVNLGRYEAGRPLDAGYAATLGADAIPVLERALGSLPAADRCTLLNAWRGRQLPDGWRSASYGLVRAKRALARQAGASGCDRAEAEPSARRPS
ncbi:MAG TPA: DUF4173 domain-containing protein [Gemmatimonadales bacterium]|nr:DUF4173 domain-containing protein [Gemmatimonadales bacterium]